MQLLDKFNNQEVDQEASSKLKNEKFCSTATSSTETSNDDAIALSFKGVPPSPPPQSRRFNIVLSGIDEHPPGTPRSVRLSRDVASISSVLDKLVNFLSDQSIRDCIRLGKFTTTGSRPILVILNRVSDVSKILSNKHKLSDCSPGILIRPDLSPSQRKA
uniref:Uncharacterized protein n=1 Tax=Amphimedon queenslandica TaxID=400682 RepID=A0A1X7THX7_AMPQE